MAPVKTNNLAHGCAIRCNGHDDTLDPDLANNGDVHSTWYTAPGDETGWLEVVFPRPTALNCVLFVELVGHWGDYPASRIGRYRFVAFVLALHKKEGGYWLTLIDAGPPTRSTTDHWLDARVVASKLRFEFVVTRDTAHVCEIGAYDEPVREEGWDGEGVNEGAAPALVVQG